MLIPNVSIGMSRDIVCQPGSNSQIGLCSVSIKVGATSAKGGGLPRPRTGAERAGKKPTLANYDLQVASIASGISGQIRVEHQSQMSKLEADRK
jgi:hypothetical protein